MSNRVADLRKPALPNGPAIANFEGHRPAKAHNIHQILMAQDQPLGVGRRVVLSLGMKGRPQNEVNDVDVDDGDDYQAHPAATDERVIHRSPLFWVTPGHALRIEARCLPSGPTGGKTSNGDGTFATDYSGTQGKLRVSVTWGTSAVAPETVVSELDFPADETEYGHGPDVHGMGFSQLTERWTTNFPSDAFFDSNDLVTWTGGGASDTYGQAFVSITVYAVGGLRPVDIVIHEIPWKVARANGVTATAAHIYQSFEQIIGAYPFAYPVEGASSGDQRFGSQHVLNVKKQHGFRMGPTLFSASSHVSGQTTEADGDEYVPDPWTTDSTSYVEVGYKSSPTGDDPSWDIGGGAYGRRFENSATDFATEDTGIVHVVWTVRGKVTGGTGTVKIQTAPHSYTTIEITDTDWETVWMDGYLECGKTPLDQQTVIAYFKVSSGSYTLSVSDITCHYFGAL